MAGDAINFHIRAFDVRVNINVHFAVLRSDQYGNANWQD